MSAWVRQNGRQHGQMKGSMKHLLAMRQNLKVAAGAGVCLVTLLAGTALAQTVAAAPTKPHLVTHALVDKSVDEIRNYVSDYTQARFSVLGGTPNIPVVRRITTTDMPALGLDRVSFRCGEPPLVFALVLGNFDVSAGVPNRRRVPQPTRVDRIAYVFDATKGVAAFEAFGGVDVPRVLGFAATQSPQSGPVLVPSPAAGTRATVSSEPGCNGGFFPGWKTPPRPSREVGTPTPR